MNTEENLKEDEEYFNSKFRSFEKPRKQESSLFISSFAARDKFASIMPK
jgi:hypothetical protein